MKRKIFSTLVLTGLLACVAIMSSCSDDDSTPAPTVALSETLIQVKAGETISATVDVMAEAGFTSMIITRLWDGNSQGTETITSLTNNQHVFNYTVTQDDADHILSFNFEVKDTEGRVISVELVVEVELTMNQILVKYDWKYIGDFLERNNQNIAEENRFDDVLRFNEDGTFVWGYGAERNDFDNFYLLCKWHLDEDTGLLRMSREGLNFGTFLYDLDEIVELPIETLTSGVLESEVYTVEGLDAFDPTLNPSEDVVTKYVATAKSENFIPYIPDGNDPTGTCSAVPWE